MSSKNPQEPTTIILPPTTTPRTPSTHPPNPQLECPLFSKLPSEIRNEIYTYTSTSGPEDHSTSPKDDPTPVLPFLRTCRLVNYEATHLTYSTHTFRLNRANWPFRSSMQDLTARLPPVLIPAITRLLCDMGYAIHCDVYMASDHLIDAIGLFPGLRYFAVLMRSFRGKPFDLPSAEEMAQKCKCMRMPEGKGADEVGGIVARWFCDGILDDVVRVTRSLPAGERWRDERVQFQPVVRWDADVSEWVDAGWVPSKYVVPCGCGNGTSLAVSLVQETGRRIEVKTLMIQDDIGKAIDKPKVVLMPEDDADTWSEPS